MKRKPFDRVLWACRSDGSFRLFGQRETARVHGNLMKIQGARNVRIFHCRLIEITDGKHTTIKTTSPQPADKE